MADAKGVVGPGDVRTDELLISAGATSAFISPKCSSSLTLWPCGREGRTALYYFTKDNKCGDEISQCKPEDVFMLLNDIILGQNNNDPTALSPPDSYSVKGSFLILMPSL